MQVQVQLLGSDPNRMAHSALVAIAAGATAIDLNFGCPAKTVNRNGGGASLLRCPNDLRAVVTTVRQVVPSQIPVSAKLRLGWDDPDEIFAHAETMAAAGMDWITIHGRTRTQGYRPPADWHRIGEVRRCIPIPVVANGDIKDLDSFRRCRDITGCEHFMIGRGALANPWMVSEIAVELGLSAGSVPSCWAELFESYAQDALQQGVPEKAIVARLKHWASLGQQAGTFNRFEEFKFLANLESARAFWSFA